ncbi:MAG: aldo/keto reductase, partial [Lactimicrobium massiliense]
MHAINETVTNLHNGVRVPTLGYRVIPGHANTVNNVLTALSAGIRHFDISSHPDVEKAFAKAVSKTNVPREELFLTVRIANEDHGYERAIHAFRNSLTRLQTD